MRPNSQTLSLAEAAEILGFSYRTAYRMKDEAVAASDDPRSCWLLPGVRAFKVSRCWRVSRFQLERFVRGEMPA